MGFYTSWGTQARFTPKEFTGRHDVRLVHNATGSFTSSCDCGWRSVATTDAHQASRHGESHVGQVGRLGKSPRTTSPSGEKLLTVRSVNKLCREGFGRVPKRRTAWARQLVGGPVDDFLRLIEDRPLLVGAALAGEPCPDDRLLPPDPGDLSALSLLVAWAPDTTDEELQASLHWASADYRGTRLPLRPGYCPSLYAFLDSRGGTTKLRGSDEFALVATRLARDAGRAASLEFDYRTRLGTPAATELERLIGGPTDRR